MSATPRSHLDSPVLLTRAEAGKRLQVDPTTVSHWARQGKLRCRRTLGGHRRFFESDIDRIIAGEDPAEVYRSGEPA